MWGPAWSWRSKQIIVLGPSRISQGPLPPEFLGQAPGSSCSGGSPTPKGMGRLCRASGISFRQFSRPCRGQAPEAASVFTIGKRNVLSP